MSIAPPLDTRAGAPSVRLRGVVKRFGSLTAVDHLDLEVPPGVCFGLLGPNGAGKSTTMRLLTGQAVADEGLVEVLGHPLPSESKAARARCGVVPQVDDLDDELTVAENLGVYARFHGIPRRERTDAVARGLQIAELVDRADTPTEELSGGMRRRLLIARGLVHRPELVLLDEPTVGLDPQVRAQLWATVDAIKHAGATVVLTTHYIEEAERLCDEVAVVHHGRIVARGTPDDLIRDHVGRDVLEIPGRAEDLAAITAEVRAAGFATRSAGTAVAVLGAERLEPGVAARGRRRTASLEDVFVVLTGEEPDPRPASRSEEVAR
ncbi:ABC transporter ATP-binding protein [Nitriliruptor alkaliphilus]|uniref:ABC transporter ATP-binding protein n=1 Tax=Nitriliruptor alkaliphilus TaxID=427918 RepID=UPI000A4F9A88|nr:ABC transporter ATP-binding protein [Nitriliruptor alkaliphilus]